MKENKLIAEFMGLSIKEGVCYYTDADDMFPMGIEVKEPYIPYHTSWDWLMPVVEKIESDERYDVDIMQYGTRISDNQEEIVNNIANISFDKKIDHTYQAVVEFIKTKK